MITSQDQISTQVEGQVYPMLIIFMISYYMAALIMNVFQTVSVTLLQCVYIDLDLSAQAHQDVSAGARPEEIE